MTGKLRIITLSLLSRTFVVLRNLSTRAKQDPDTEISKALRSFLCTTRSIFPHDSTHRTFSSTSPRPPYSTVQDPGAKDQKIGDKQAAGLDVSSNVAIQGWSLSKIATAIRIPDHDQRWIRADFGVHSYCASRKASRVRHHHSLCAQPEHHPFSHRLLNAISHH